MNAERKTDIHQLFDELDAGALGKRVMEAIRQTSLGIVAVNDKKKRGKVVLTFDIGQIGESNQVHIDHTLEFKKPTHRGSASEVHTTSSAMYVDLQGNLTVLNNATRPMFATGDAEA